MPRRLPLDSQVLYGVRELRGLGDGFDLNSIDLSSHAVDQGFMTPGTIEPTFEPIGTLDQTLATVSSSGPSGGGSSPWLSILNTAVAGGTSILKTRFAVPQLAPGTVIQTGPGGSYMANVGSAGSPALSFGGLTSGNNSLWILLAIGAGIFLLASRH